MERSVVDALWETLLENGASIQGAELLSESFCADIFAPFDRLEGKDQFLQGYLNPLLYAFDGLQRDSFFTIEGEFNGELWITQTGYYSGVFKESWLGVSPSMEIETLRFGEFYKIRDGKICEAIILFDLLDFLYRTGKLPANIQENFRFDAGNVPSSSVLESGPRDVHDQKSAESLRLVEAMIFEGLFAFKGDSKDLACMQMYRYWHPNMRWYGPGGIGTCYGLSEFENFHQRPFLSSFPDRMGAHHRARIAQGAGVASTGWPSIQAHIHEPWLGCSSGITKQAITMRVMDWWTAHEGMLFENWVLIDIVDVFRQLGVSLAELGINA